MSDQECSKIIKIENIICGNGSPGLAKQVADHEIYIQQQIGSLKTIKAGLLFLGITNIGTLTAFLIQTFAK